MPQVRSTILDDVELLLPVLTPCDHQEGNINLILTPIAGEDELAENWGQGSEDEQTDNCTDCDSLGILEDAYPFFFIPAVRRPYEDDRNEYVIALRMDNVLIEMLQRAIRNFEEERFPAKTIRVYPAHDPMFGNEESGEANLGDNFHVFDSEYFTDPDFDFDKPPFVERRMSVVVGWNGVQLLADISLPGDNEVEMGTVETIWLSEKDLAALNTWLVERQNPRR